MPLRIELRPGHHIAIGPALVKNYLGGKAYLLFETDTPVLRHNLLVKPEARAAYAQKLLDYGFSPQIVSDFMREAEKI